MDFMLLLDMISIHAPRTGSDFFPDYGKRLRHISIHAPRTGSDSIRPSRISGYTYFNPRSPHGERHTLLAHNAKILTISIHAPRTGSDKFNLHTARNILYFNPRSPHGERREHLASTLTAE